ECTWPKCSRGILAIPAHSGPTVPEHTLLSRFPGASIQLPLSAADRSAIQTGNSCGCELPATFEWSPGVPADPGSHHIVPAARSDALPVPPAVRGCDPAF